MVRYKSSATRLNLLITLRDMGAAGHLIPVIQAALQDSRFNVFVWAQHPASELLEKNRIKFKYFPQDSITKTNSGESHGFLSLVAENLKTSMVDASLVGLSTPFDGGIDEAVVAISKTPTYLFQDFWGEMNTFFGGMPDSVFALDGYAKALNEKRYKVASHIVGSPKHSAYARLNIPEKRSEIRKRFGFSTKIPTIGYFGQALHSMAGYRTSVEIFIQALKRLDAYQLIVKPHPRESSQEKELLRALFQDANLRYSFTEESSVEDLILACDIVCSMFSNCNFDACYINWFSSEDGCVPLSLLYNEEIFEYYAAIVDVDRLPVFQLDLVQKVLNQEELEVSLKRALDPSFRRQVVERAKDYLPDPKSACSKILDHIYVEHFKRP